MAANATVQPGQFAIDGVHPDKGPVGKPLDTETITQRDAREIMAAWLEQYGLESLTDWANEQITEGVTDPAVLRLRLEDQPAFQERFAPIFERREAGLSPISVDEVLLMEREYHNIMSLNGLPEQFYDSITDFHHLIVADVSPDELASRVEDGYNAVTHGPPEIRAAFAGYYGVQGDDMLAAMYLDPDKATPILEKRTTTAQIGGTAERYGMHLLRLRAERLAEIGVTQRQAEESFTRLGDMANVFRGRIGTADDERAMSMEIEGIGAELEGDTEAGRFITQRRQEREGTTRGGGSAAIQEKTSSIGTAERA